MSFLKTVLVAALMLSLAAASYAEKAPQKIVDLANSELAALGSDPVIVAAVKAANAEGRSLDQIKSKDEQWKAHAGIADYMKAIMNSECGKHLTKYQAENDYCAEIFVMDNQGANVAMTDKTSDYWQGDEAKFIESYAGGKGAIHLGEVEFDDSAQAYVVQVSVPVRDGDQVIGAITFGIDVDAIE